MRVISRVCAGMIIANCLGYYGWSIPESATEQELAVAAESLGSSDFLLATEGTRILFAAGSRAIPHLIAKFGDQTEFQGLCGMLILKSEMAPPVDPWNEISRLASLPPRISVRDVSLYLVVAIVRDNLYFAERCKPVVGPSPRIKTDPLGDALDNIRSTYEKSVADRTPLNRESIERMLKLHAVTFPVSIEAKAD